MKILYITGEDFAAVLVEREYGLQKAIQLCEENGGSYTIETDDIYAELSVKQYGDVDIKFIEFIKENFIDYDHSKTTNFFVID